MEELFDLKLRALRRDRAARTGPELFLYERAFADCLERLELTRRRFDRALLIGCPDANWPNRLSTYADQVEVLEPGPLFAARSGGTSVTEDAWHAPAETYDLVLAVGTLDTVTNLPLALRLMRRSMRPDSFLLGAVSGGDTVPQLRSAMRAADAVVGTAAPHVHPRIEAAALAPLLEDAGFHRPVIDIDRVLAMYPTLQKLIGDLRKMGATNLLRARPRYVGRDALAAANETFDAARRNSRTAETFEILHFAAWTPAHG